MRKQLRQFASVLRGVNIESYTSNSTAGSRIASRCSESLFMTYLLRFDARLIRFKVKENAAALAAVGQPFSQCEEVVGVGTIVPATSFRASEGPARLPLSPS
jgi:hypothetical protein